MTVQTEKRITPSVLPLAGAVFAAGTGILVANYISMFYGRWAVPPWLYALLPLFALESVYYSAYVLSPRSPFTWRVMELSAAAALIMLCLRLEHSCTYPLWAFWHYLRDLEFLVPFSLVLLTWAMAGGFGGQMARIARVRDELGDQATATLSCEYDSLSMKAPEASLPIEYFLARLMGVGFLLACLAVAAQRRGDLAGAPVGTRLVLGALHVLTLASGLFLLGSAYLHRLTTIWFQVQLSYPPQLAARWLRNLAVVCLAAAVIVSVMPVDFSPITVDEIIRALARLAARAGRDAGLSVQSEVPAGRAERLPPVPLGELEHAEPSFWVGVLTLLYMLFTALFTVTAALTFLGFLIVAFAQAELERIQGLPRAAVRLYQVVRESVQQLSRFFLRQLRRVRDKAASMQAQAVSLGQPDGGGEEQRRRENVVARDIRAAFRQLVQAAAAAGHGPRPGETPAEFGRRLAAVVPEDEEEVSNFIAHYHVARYSRRGLGTSLRQRALGEAERIMERLRRMRGRKGNE